MTDAITVDELRQLLQDFPGNTLVLMETESGCYAQVERPDGPYDNVPPFSQQEMEPANCHDRADPGKEQTIPQTAVCLIPGKHWRIRD